MNKPLWFRCIWLRCCSSSLEMNLEVDAVIGDARVAIEIKSTDHVDHDDKKGVTDFFKALWAGEII